MKKKLPFLLIALGLVAAICAAVIVSCATSAPDEGGDDDTSTNALTAEGTVTEETHLAQSEGTEVIDDTDSIPTPPTDTDTPAKTDAKETEVENESETESETSPLDDPVPTLEFFSNGNGTCTVIGVGTVNDSYIAIPARSPQGDVVISIAANAFCGNINIKAIEIPSTVMSIGDMAFSGCPSLLYITVDKNNTMFTDVSGVLYTKDLTALLCYPSGSGVSTVNIPLSVKKISPMAFYDCVNLKTVNYDGSAEHWSHIIIGELNYGLYTASVCFTEEN